jgi:hypothetical protein
MRWVYLIAITCLLIAGCATKEGFVCDDGTKVSDETLCLPVDLSNVTPLDINELCADAASGNAPEICYVPRE